MYDLESMSSEAEPPIWRGWASALPLLRQARYEAAELFGSNGGSDSAQTRANG